MAIDGLALNVFLNMRCHLSYLDISTTEVGGIRDVAQLFWGNVFLKEV